MKKKVETNGKWALAKVGDPGVLFVYNSKEQAERNKGGRIDLEVRRIIG